MESTVMIDNSKESVVVDGPITLVYTECEELPMVEKPTNTNQETFVPTMNKDAGVVNEQQSIKEDIVEKAMNSVTNTNNSKESSGVIESPITLIYTPCEDIPMVETPTSENQTAAISINKDTGVDETSPVEKDNDMVASEQSSPEKVSHSLDANESPSHKEEHCNIKLDEIPTDVTYCDTIDRSLEYTIVAGASQRKRHKLVDSNGYVYTIKRTNKDSSVTWRCTNREKAVDCRVRIRQHGVYFTKNFEHTHPGNPGEKLKWSVVSDIKRKASLELNTPIDYIVKQTLLEYVNDGPFTVLPSEMALKRQARRFRESSLKPVEPTDLKFILSAHAIPDGFLRADIVRGKQRHLIFASEDQLDVLARGKRWYVDVTTKLVNKPFSQLLTIHCFVREDNEIKQVPLCFVIMSNKFKSDYIAIFEMVKRILPRNIQLEQCVLDFDEGLWEALAQVFPNAKASGCSYMWTQAVWQKVQDLGLTKAYLNKKKTHSRLRKLMALPYMPCEIIPEMFQQLFEKVDKKKKLLLEIYNYANNTWISDGTIWPPRVWSVFGQSVRTNNDVDGWHSRILLKGPKSKFPLYKLIKVLHDEVKQINPNTSLVKEEKLKKFQCKTYKNLHGRLNIYWTQFRNGRRSADALLNACSHLYG